MDNQTVEQKDLEAYLAKTLDVTRFKDFCPNGLQVAGKATIRKLITGVTASVALIDAAIEQRADAILVHHGYFWRGEDPRIIGPKHQRLKKLLAQDVNLFAYHLPLDAHPLMGNNAQLGKILGLSEQGRFGADELGWWGQAEPDLRTVDDLAQRIESRLGRVPLIIGDGSQLLERVAWCTGAAQGFLGEAIAAGATVYLSGEISEPTVHLARESGVTYLACGHHATERYGVQALGQHIAEYFSIEHQFIEIGNPV